MVWLARTWAAIKALVGIGLLVSGGLYAAQRLDRERGEEAAQDLAYAQDPGATGAISPRQPTPGGPTQRPSW